jgi:hypothetical protein
MTGFTYRERQAVLSRDGWVCSMGCGSRATQVNHRANRGAGGSRSANRVGNACAICADCNFRLEDDAVAARKARELGVKISRHDDPESVPFYSQLFGMWAHLHDDGMTFDVTPEEIAAHLHAVAAMA